MRAERTLYQVLQVDAEAEPEVIEAAYRRLARKYHPDLSGGRDAGARMKEINAAYGILRDPLQRAAYDRDLDQRTAPDDDWEEHGEAMTSPRSSPVFACRLHPAASVVGPCSDCGAWLCRDCFDRFQPSSCAPCLLAWASQRRTQLMLPMIWFVGVVALLGWFVLAMAPTGPGGHTAPLVLVAELVAVYVIASLPSGWRVIQAVGADEAEDVAMALLWAVVLGPLVAPFRIGKALWDLRRLRELEAMAKAVG